MTSSYDGESSPGAPKPTAVKGYCVLCKSRCGVVADVSADGRLLAVRPDREHPNRGFCVKGASAPQLVEAADRLKYPMRRTKPKGAADPGWERISWDEAMSVLARRLGELASEHGPESVVFTRPAPGGSAAGEWVTYLQRLAAAFGTPNVMTTGHICSWGRGAGSSYTYGRALPVAHYEAARTMLVWGHNPAVSHMQSWGRIRAAQQRGSRLVVVDPRRTSTAERADLWLRLRPGSDAALALGAVRLMLERGAYDPVFAARWTNGPLLVDTSSGRLLRAAELAGEDRPGFVVWDRQRGAAAIDTWQDPDRWDVDPQLGWAGEITLADGRRVAARTAFGLLTDRVAGYDPATVADLTGVPAVQLTELADALADGPVCLDSYNGVEQHTDTAQTARALGIMYALTGWLEAPGGNVTFGGKPGRKRAGPGPAQRPLGFEARPLGAARGAVQAYNLYDSVLRAHPYRVRALVAFGGNALLQNGDTRTGRAALEALDFQVHIDMFENPTAHTADLLLPAASAWESPGLATSFGGGPQTQRYAQYRPPVVAPVGESRPDIEIIFDLAARLGLADQFWGGDVRAAFEAQLRPLGISLAQLTAQPAGMQLGGEPGFRSYARCGADGVVQGFPTPTGKVELYSETFLEHGYDPLPSAQDRRSEFAAGYPFILTSNKLIQFTHSTGRSIPALRKQVPEPYLELNPADAERLRVRDGQPVRLSTAIGSIRLTARLTDRVLPGVVSTQTGWWQACAELGLPGHDPFGPGGANVNLIIGNDVLDPISGSVPLKDYPCRIDPIACDGVDARTQGA
jgi:anaerobic selenocysteine-containing dehydrogenase